MRLRLILTAMFWLLGSVEIIHTIDIDDLPPMLSEEISEYRSNRGNDKVRLSREHQIGECDNLMQWDDPIDDEHVDHTEVE